MPANVKTRFLKVCSTCRQWSHKYKGLCTRLNQGVGKFWTCEDWEAASEQNLGQGGETKASGPSTLNL